MTILSWLGLLVVLAQRRRQAGAQDELPDRESELLLGGHAALPKNRQFFYLRMPHQGFDAPVCGFCPHTGVPAPMSTRRR